MNSFEQEAAAGSDIHFVRDRIPVTSLVIGGGTKNVTTTAIKAVTNARFYEIKRDQDKIMLTTAVGSILCE